MKTIRFTGVNVQIVNGLGATNGNPADPGSIVGTVNGLGNLIVGYNEQVFFNEDHTGSHNIVVGTDNDYTSWGGPVVGRRNEISGPWSSVSGGIGNKASGIESSVPSILYSTLRARSSSFSLDK